MDLCDDINPEFEIFEGEENDELEEFLELLEKEEDEIEKETIIQKIPSELRIYFRRNIEHLISRIKIVASSHEDAFNIRNFLNWECFNFFQNSPLEFDIDVDHTDLLHIFANLNDSKSRDDIWGSSPNLNPCYRKVYAYC